MICREKLAARNEETISTLSVFLELEEKGFLSPDRLTVLTVILEGVMEIDHPCNELGPPVDVPTENYRNFGLNGKRPKFVCKCIITSSDKWSESSLIASMLDNLSCLL